MACCKLRLGASRDAAALIVGRIGLLEATQQFVGQSIAWPVLDARGSSIERISDVARISRVHDQRQLLGACFVADGLQNA